MNIPFPFLFDKKTGTCIALTKKDALELMKELELVKELKRRVEVLSEDEK